jgi:hypothetical protein
VRRQTLEIAAQPRSQVPWVSRLLIIDPEANPAAAGVDVRCEPVALGVKKLVLIVLDINGLNLPIHGVHRVEYGQIPVLVRENGHRDIWHQSLSPHEAIELTR